MRKIILMTILIGFISCNSRIGNRTNVAREEIADNQELSEMFKSDQADRTIHIDRDILQKNDSLREARVYELLDSDKVRTSLDYTNSALIFFIMEKTLLHMLWL